MKITLRELMIIVLLSLSPLSANPVSSLYKIVLHNENVEIILNKSSGNVQGTFTFVILGSKDVGADDQLPPGYSAGISIPVYLPKDSLQEKIWQDSVMVDIKCQMDSMEVRRPYKLKDPYGLFMPRMMQLEWYKISISKLEKMQCKKQKIVIPTERNYEMETDPEKNLPSQKAKLLRDSTFYSYKGLDVNISYRQPTYSENNQTRFIYTPIIPHMSKQENYSITLKCPSNLKLALVTKNETTAASDSSITVAPKHLEAIIVSISEREKK